MDDKKLEKRLEGTGIGLIVDKSNAVGWPRVLPPTPYVKIENGRVIFKPENHKKSYHIGLIGKKYEQ